MQCFFYIIVESILNADFSNIPSLPYAILYFITENLLILICFSKSQQWCSSLLIDLTCYYYKWAHVNILLFCSLLFFPLLWACFLCVIQSQWWIKIYQHLIATTGVIGKFTVLCDYRSISIIHLLLFYIIVIFVKFYLDDYFNFNMMYT